MVYGMPYKGSKSAIAEKIVAALPMGDTFVDLFCGGGAIAHAAILSGKYKSFIINDADKLAVEAFLGGISGKYREERRWISREDFFRLKDTDGYIKCCWSFGNNGRNYLYAKSKEPWKKALHYAVVFQDYSEFEKLGIPFAKPRGGG